MKTELWSFQPGRVVVKLFLVRVRDRVEIWGTSQPRNRGKDCRAPAKHERGAHSRRVSPVALAEAEIEKRHHRSTKHTGQQCRGSQPHER